MGRGSGLSGISALAFEFRPAGWQSVCAFPIRKRCFEQPFLYIRKPSTPDTLHRLCSEGDGKAESSRISTKNLCKHTNNLNKLHNHNNSSNCIKSKTPVHLPPIPIALSTSQYQSPPSITYRPQPPTQLPTRDSQPLSTSSHTHPHNQPPTRATLHLSRSLFPLSHPAGPHKQTRS